MEDWKRDEWQGRRKDQYENSALAFTIAAAGAAVLAVVYVIMKLI